jgi:tetratricopeptide (TPR) repeat protein
VYKRQADENGTAFFDISTNPLKYRKMFCWGTHTGGNHWQEYLSDGNTEYFEIQAGLAPSQLHGIIMPKNTVWEFTQCFGSVNIECTKTHYEDWYTSRDYIESMVYSKISESELLNIDKEYKELAHVIPTEILTKADGWGALEVKRLASKGINVTPSMVFDDSTLNEQQLPWLELLNGNGMSVRSKEEFVPSWMIQNEWFELLKASIESGNKSWNALLHLGIMYYEQNEHEKAVHAWKESNALLPNVWAMRNLAFAYKESGETNKVYECMDKLWEMKDATSDQAFGLEYLTALVEIKDYEKAWQVFNSLPYDFQKDERIEIIAGKVAMELGNLDFVKGLFTKDYAIIREGENTITDLWFKYHTKIRADELGIAVSDELFEKVVIECPPPKNIDFRQSL